MKLTLPQIRLIILVATGLILSFFTGVWASDKGLSFRKEGISPKITIDRTPKKDLDFALFWNVWDRLEEDYFDKTKLDPKEMIYGAIKGMVAAVGDPYTSFLPPKEQKMTKEDLDGEFEGVGIQIGFKGSRLTVIAPLEDEPAQRAGIKAGDFIIGIKDEKKGLELATYGMTLPEAVQAIRGPAGTNVTLVVTREGEDKPLEIEITRAKIDVPSVELEFVGKAGDIAHLKLTRFSGSTEKEWSKAIEEVRRKARGVILDLRNNPGGFLVGSVDIVSEFLKEGIVVVQEDGKGKKQSLSVSGKARLADIPLVVLTNGGSASASEIVAAALKDYERAKIVGETTFGKGTIQEAQAIDSSGLHITTARWLTPKGTWFDKEGLKPDIELEDDEETEDIDEQLEEAIKIINTKF